MRVQKAIRRLALKPCSFKEFYDLVGQAAHERAWHDDGQKPLRIGPKERAPAPERIMRLGVLDDIELALAKGYVIAALDFQPLCNPQDSPGTLERVVMNYNNDSSSSGSNTASIKQEKINDEKLRESTAFHYPIKPEFWDTDWENHYDWESCMTEVPVRYVQVAEGDGLRPSSPGKALAQVHSRYKEDENIEGKILILCPQSAINDMLYLDYPPPSHEFRTKRIPNTLMFEAYAAGWRWAAFALEKKEELRHVELVEAIRSYLEANDLDFPENGLSDPTLAVIARKIISQWKSPNLKSPAVHNSRAPRTVK